MQMKNQLHKKSKKKSLLPPKAFKCRTHSEVIKAWEWTTKRFKETTRPSTERIRTVQNTFMYETVKKGVHKYTQISMCGPSIHKGMLPAF